MEYLELVITDLERRVFDAIYKLNQSITDLTGKDPEISIKKAMYPMSEMSKAIVQEDLDKAKIEEIDPKPDTDDGTKP
jgi:hypothetical protein